MVYVESYDDAVLLADCIDDFEDDSRYFEIMRCLPAVRWAKGKTGA